MDAAPSQPSGLEHRKKGSSDDEALATQHENASYTPAPGHVNVGDRTSACNPSTGETGREFQSSMAAQPMWISEPQMPG